MTLRVIAAIGFLVTVPLCSAALLWITQPDGVSFQTTAFDGALLGRDAGDFYDYRSYSAHTGFEAQRTSLLFAYEHAGELKLFSIHNVDRAGGAGRVTQHFAGLPSNWTLDLRDDPGDRYTLATDALEARWQWRDNTDGLVLGLGLVSQLAGQAITITCSNWAGFDAWRFLGADGAASMQLDPRKAVTIAIVPEPATLALLCCAVFLLVKRPRL